MACGTNAAEEKNGVEQVVASRENSGVSRANGFTKSIKLVMTPLIGIISSKCDVSIHSSCLNTWCYLLHKLDTSINDPSVINLVLEPIFEAVFRMGPGGKSTRLWNLCLDLLDAFILAKCGDVEHDASSLASQQLPARTSISEPSIPGKFLLKRGSVKWLPWDVCQVDFHLNMIFIVIDQASTASVTHENRSFACEVALRLFISVLKGVQLELKNPSTRYNDIMLCLGKLLRFVKRICEDVNSDRSDSNDLNHTSLRFIEAVTQELEPAILGSPLYKVPLDLKYIDDHQLVNLIRHAKVLALCSPAYMRMVSPVAYLVVLYVSVVFQSTTNTSNPGFIFQGMHPYFKFLFSSHDPLEILLATVGLLYKSVSPNCLNIWLEIATGLEPCTDDVKELSLLRVGSDSTGYFATSYLLSYPFALCCCPKKSSTSLINVSLERSHVSPPGQINLECIIEVWKSLYGSFRTSQSRCSAMNGFLVDLCSMINECLDNHDSIRECTDEVDSSCKDLVPHLIYLFGDVVVYLLEDICASEIVSDEGTCKYSGDDEISRGRNSALRLAAR